MRKKIGLLGGTFDPPHLGHLIIANEVLVQLNLDEIHFMPNQEPPHKERSSKTTAQERIEMLQLVTHDHPAFSIEPIELERTGRSYTFDTMNILIEENPEHEYYFIIGADMVEYLPHWHKIDELMKMIRFIGVNRPHHQLATTYPIMAVSVPQIDISSTMIRERQKSGHSIRYLLPKALIRFIEENHLYES